MNSDNTNTAKGADLNPFAWVEAAGGPAVTFEECKYKHLVIGMPESGWQSFDHVIRPSFDGICSLNRTTEFDQEISRSTRISVNDSGLLIGEVCLYSSHSDVNEFKVFARWYSEPSADFWAIHSACASHNFSKIERSGVTFWKGGNEVTARWTGFQGVNKILITESSISDPYRWMLSTKSNLIDELRSLLGAYTCIYQFDGAAVSLEAAIDDALSVVDKLREVCAKIAAIGPAVVPVAQDPHPLDNFWSDQESKLSRSVAENQISNAPAFNQTLDDVDPFIIPLDDLLSLIEQAPPDDRSKGFLTGVYQCRTQFEILAGSAV